MIYFLLVNIARENCVVSFCKKQGYIAPLKSSEMNVTVSCPLFADTSARTRAETRNHVEAMPLQCHYNALLMAIV
jgi:hypothetical protein